MSKLLSIICLANSIWCVHGLGVAFFDVYLFAVGGIYFLVDSAVAGQFQDKSFWSKGNWILRSL